MRDMQYKQLKLSVIADSYKNQDKLDIPEKIKVVRHLPEINFEYCKETVDKLEFNLCEQKIHKNVILFLLHFKSTRLFLYHPTTIDS